MNLFTEFDSYLFHQGTNYEAYLKMGAHTGEEDGKSGTRFVVWAPGARSVAVICARTGWENEWYMDRSENGVWEAFIPGVGDGDAYRFVIVGADGVKRYKTDPYAFRCELRPDNAAIVCAPSGYEWKDAEYQAKRDNTKVVEKPMAIYEVHLGSWKKWPGSGPEDGFLNYRELADQLAGYITYMGYTHIELIGICEYPFDGSWGYQVTGYFAPTSRYGVPDDFRYFVDKMHSCGIGVILDWVPAHFPKDDFSLADFDGTPLYESADPLKAEYPEWGTKAFDHGRPEVRSFLISSAFYWIKEFHIDALRVDAVAAMIYTNFSRNEWRPNKYGGVHNIESMDFLRQLNYEVKIRTTGYLIAEDSSIEAGVTSDEYDAALGFTLKWNMGWMNDTLKYIGKDPVFRTYHHGALTHSPEYAFLENYVLVLSHDEVVHLKHSMVEKSPGKKEDRLGCLKAVYTYQFTHPGKKLLFMGQDFAMEREWDEGRGIDWHLADELGHRDVMLTVRKLLSIYREYPVLYSDSKDQRTFEWINSADYDRNIISYIRRNPWNYNEALVVICSFSPVYFENYSCGVPIGGSYERIFSTFDALPGGGGPEDIGGAPSVRATKEECDGRRFRLTYNLRPYESVIFKFPVRNYKRK